MNNDKLDKVNSLLNEERVDEAFHLFQKLQVLETEEYWLTKGKLEQKFQHWGNAMNAFSKVLEINSENSEATNQLHFIHNILNFWNPEMFNP